MKKIVKRSLIILSVLFLTIAIFVCLFVGISLLKFSTIPLNVDALSDTSISVELFDKKNRPIKENLGGKGVKISDLSEETKNAFISIEDKEFYSHHGLNYKRMVGAMVENVKSGSLKEGASTISQQLIKNTHLSSEKTFERKLKEIALTKKLEKTLSKEEILQSYLGVIFFGNNCYGLENASEYYFNKDAKDLTLTESCTLAALIKSPSKYSPISHPENALKRRNLVISEMEKDGYITQEQAISAQNEDINLNVTPHTSKINSYAQSAIDEAAKILSTTPKQVALGGYHIHTYQNQEKQSALEVALSTLEKENFDKAAIVIDNATRGVCAYVGESAFKILSCQRQPASCLKPLLVYAPALNECIISPETQILDEPLTIGDYSPSNINQKYGGYMSVTDAVKNSVNIPAIKCLSYVGLDKGKAYAKKLGINFDSSDNSYSLALGGMTYGVNLLELTSAYTVFPNGGQFQETNFVQYITDSNGKLVFTRKIQPKTVFREDSAYLMTKILQETATSGTARKLSDVKNCEVAAKTGTVGTRSGGNTDAYTIAYNPEEVVGVWCGSLDNFKLKIAGGNQPATVAREYLLSQTYQNSTFTQPSTVVELEIDMLELEENHRLTLATPSTPERYKKKCLFSRFNSPETMSQNFLTAPKITANASVENGQIVLNLTAQKHVDYQIFKDDIPSHHINGKSDNLTLRLSMPEDECSIKIVARNASAPELSTQEIFHLKRPTAQPAPKSKWYV